MVRALSAGKLYSYREGAQISGLRTSLLAEDEGLKQDLSPKVFCFGLPQKLLASVVHTLTCTEGFGNQDGSLRCFSEALPAGQTPLLWQGRFPDIWSPKWGLSQKLSSRDLGGVCRLCAQVTKCWHWPEGTCDPGQAGFPASLMLSQVLRDWIRTEFVFHSPVVLRSHGESSRGPWGCPKTPRPRWPGAGADRKGLVTLLRPDFLLS